MTQGVQGVFQGIADLVPETTIIVTNYSRESRDNQHIYHLREFVDESTKKIYQEDGQETTLSNLCPGCVGAGYETMFAKIISTQVKDNSTYFDFIPLAID